MRHVLAKPDGCERLCENEAGSVEGYPPCVKTIVEIVGGEDDAGEGGGGGSGPRAKFPPEEMNRSSGGGESDSWSVQRNHWS